MTNPTLLGCGGHENGGTGYSAVTYYANVGLGRCPLGENELTNEPSASQIVRVAGSISYLSWGVDTSFGASLTLTLRKNSANSLLAVSITTTGFVTDGSSIHHVSVAAGDSVDFGAAVGSAVTGFSGGFYCISERFEASSGTAQMLATVGPMGLNPPSTSREFGNFLGVLLADSTESEQQFQSLAAGTWQNMACYVDSNTYTGTVTVNNRINSSNGSMCISVSTTATGYFEDTTDSDTVAVDDLLCYGFVGSVEEEGQSTDIYWIGAHFLPTDSGLCMIGGSDGGTAVITGTKYSSLFGDGQIDPTGTGGTTRATGLIPYALAASGFTSYLTAAGTGDSATFTVLQNGSGSALAITSTAGISGRYKTSSTDSVDFSIDDTCADEIDLASGTSVTWASGSVLLQSS